MNPKLKLAALSAGGVTLFALSFVTFSAFSGTPLHENALLGKFIEAPEEQEPAKLTEGQSAPDPVEKQNREELIEGSLAVSASFVLPSPFTSTELESLTSELKAKKLDYETRLTKLRDRERALEEREALVEERYSELATLRNALQEFELELQLRSAEVDRDERAQEMREKQSWRTVARTFEEGDVEEQIKKLMTYSPDDAAKILSALNIERMRELTGALPVDRYQEYMDAYRRKATESDEP